MHRDIGLLAACWGPSVAGSRKSETKRKVCWGAPMVLALHSCARRSCRRKPAHPRLPCIGRSPPHNGSDYPVAPAKMYNTYIIDHIHRARQAAGLETSGHC